jgi:acetyl-CoA carboxylase biotin carboxyl carrier protein
MMNVDVDTIKQLLELVREHELAEFELEQDGIKIRVRKQGAVQTVSIPAAAALPAGPIVPAVLPAAPAASLAPVPSAAPAPADEFESVELNVITAPIVGTFYRAPTPESPPFVEVGARVHKGQVLCIIEAMKLMNEIESDVDGELVKIYVENGQPVQYAERMFAIKP